eukprot:TRINITY_DN13078_c0_g1_i5.p1 TRINITY_DN13078_c0_g1~~TRINITY_DN13078_c0_g1_i5.p1  ORF type:complete len:482 (+),score=94.74 TRINITY_DN13078_c0_g1_i5:88-1533(+)
MGEQEPETSRSWVMKNTFIETVDQRSCSGIGRASTDSALHKVSQHGQLQDEEVEELHQKHGTGAAAVEFDLTGLSDTDSDPDTDPGNERSACLPCYPHIQEDGLPSVGSRWQSLKEDLQIAFTPSPRSPRGMEPVAHQKGSDTEEEGSKKVLSFDGDDENLTSDVTVKAASPGMVACSRGNKEMQALLDEILGLQEENKQLKQQVLEPGIQAEVPTCGSAPPCWLAMPMAVPCFPVAMSAQLTCHNQADQQMCAEQAPLPVKEPASHTKHFSFRQNVTHQTAQKSGMGRNKAAGTMTLGPVPEMHTTVMLRNLPLNYNRAMVLAMLDEEGFSGRYDFLYLPMDFETGACLGYAFVNLVEPLAASELFEKFSGYSKWSVPSSKVCEVCSSPQQGLQTNIDRYRNSTVMHASVPDEYKPVVFTGGVQVAFPGPSRLIKQPRLRPREMRSSAAAHQKQQGKFLSHAQPAPVGALSADSRSRSRQ